MTKLTICVMASSLAKSVKEMADLVALLEEGGYYILERREPEYNDKHQRIEMWLQVECQQLEWCKDCNQYTPHKHYTWKYTQRRNDCSICGCPA